MLEGRVGGTRNMWKGQTPSGKSSVHVHSVSYDYDCNITFVARLWLSEKYIPRLSSSKNKASCEYLNLIRLISGFCLSGDADPLARAV